MVELGVNGATQRTDMPGLHQHLPGDTTGVQPLCLGLRIAKIAFHPAVTCEGGLLFPFYRSGN